MAPQVGQFVHESERSLAYLFGGQHLNANHGGVLVNRGPFVIHGDGEDHVRTARGQRRMNARFHAILVIGDLNDDPSENRKGGATALRSAIDENGVLVRQRWQHADDVPLITGLRPVDEARFTVIRH